MNARIGARAALGLGVSVIACVLLAHAVDLSATRDRLASAQPVWVLVPLLALAVQLVIRARRWALLLTAASASPVATRRVIGPLAVGYLGNAVLPARLGEVARAVIVARRERLPIAAVAASVIVERVVDLAALLSIGLASTWAVQAVGVVTIAATGALVVGLGVLAFLSGRLVERIPKRLPARIGNLARQFLASVGRVGPRTTGASFGLSLLAWMGDVAIVWASAEAIGLDLALPAVIAIAVGAALGTALPAASGYLGTYELGAVALGTLAGTPSDSVLAIAVLAHVFAVLPIALLGLIAMIRMGVRIDLTTPGRGPGPEAGT